MSTSPCERAADRKFSLNNLEGRPVGVGDWASTRSPPPAGPDRRAAGFSPLPATWSAQRADPAARREDPGDLRSSPARRSARHARSARARDRAGLRGQPDRSVPPGGLSARALAGVERTVRKRTARVPDRTRPPPQTRGNAADARPGAGTAVAVSAAEPPWTARSIPTSSSNAAAAAPWAPPPASPWPASPCSGARVFSGPPSAATASAPRAWTGAIEAVITGRAP